MRETNVCVIAILFLENEIASCGTNVQYIGLEKLCGENYSENKNEVQKAQE